LFHGYILISGGFFRFGLGIAVAMTILCIVVLALASPALVLILHRERNLLTLYCVVFAACAWAAVLASGQPLIPMATAFFIPTSVLWLEASISSASNARSSQTWLLTIGKFVTAIALLAFGVWVTGTLLAWDLSQLG
jgi:hypothetical protein